MAEPAPANARRKTRTLLTLALAGVVLLGGAAGTWKLRRKLFPTWFPTPKPPPPTKTDWTGAVVSYQYTTSPDNIDVAPLDVKPTITLDRAVVKTGNFDAATISTKNVALLRTFDHSIVPATVKVSGDGVSITITPDAPLKPAETYSICIGNGIRTTEGEPISGMQQTFYTDPGTEVTGSIRFEKLPQSFLIPGGVTALHFGPDGKLYASTLFGEMYRFPLNPDGTLGAAEQLPGVTVSHASLGKRILVGFVFDPKSTPDNPIIYATHTPFLGAMGTPFFKVADFSAILSKISGPNLSNVQDLLVNLPRSAIDHQTFEPIWGPDGALYFHQGASNAYGDPDKEWDMRAEHLLTASVLRLDLSKLPQTLPLDTKTIEAGGPYDPNAASAPLTVYASGIRVAYNLRFHSNGHLYGAINGSSAGGNIPKGPNSPSVPALPMTEHDWLFDIQQGKYYGHPNPSQNHFVLNGGNPTDGIDPFEIPFYPVGTMPDPKWEPPLLDVGRNISANGFVEYQNANAFGGRLKGKLVICRYNTGSDLAFVGLDENGRAKSIWTGLDGALRFRNPLAIVEDPKTGNLYVSEFAEKIWRITLLKPKP
ncbi:MAG: Ig-like domain-containing protein [Tepidisphaeraceae bacterium]